MPGLHHSTSASNPPASEGLILWRGPEQYQLIAPKQPAPGPLESIQQPQTGLDHWELRWVHKVLSWKVSTRGMISGLAKAGPVLCFSLALQHAKRSE